MMGYVPPAAPFRANIDRFGLARDYATYVWLLYRKRVADDSPERRAFLFGPQTGTFEHPNFGQQMLRR